MSHWEGQQLALKNLTLLTRVLRNVTFRIAGHMHCCTPLDSIQGVNRDLRSQFTRYC